MKNKNVVLLKAFVKSTSLFNLLKYSKDKKKKGNAVGSLVGLSILYLFLMGYCVLNSIGFGTFGMASAIPILNAILISGMSFIFTILKANAYIFEFKEYDMIVSLPFNVKTIVADKFLYMYIKNLPWNLSISVAFLVGYAISERPALIVYPLWIILSLFLPIIPMVFATFLGFLIAKIGAGAKRHTKAIQMVLVMAVVILSFSMRFIIEGVFKNNELEDVMGNMSDITVNISTYYFPAEWFADGATKPEVGSILLLIGSSVLLFEICFTIISKSFRKINSSLKSHVAKKNYKVTKYKKGNVIKAVAFKEFKRMTGSTVYLTNAAIGYILAIILGIVSLFVGIEKALSTIVQGVNVTTEMIYPAIPLVVYLMVGMISTTACSPSLEGKNFWIIKSLPIRIKDLCLGKMLFNMCLAVPSMLISTICLCISGKVPVLNALLYVVCGFALCCFSTTFGLVCGIKFIKLEFENDVEVVKQGAAMVMYILPNMFVVMFLIVGFVFLGLKMNGNILVGIFTVIVFLLSYICLKWSLSLATKKL